MSYLCFGSHFRCHFFKEASFDTSSTLSCIFLSEYLQLVITVYWRNTISPQECRFHEGRDCSCFVATDNLASTHCTMCVHCRFQKFLCKESKKCCIILIKQYSLNAQQLAMYWVLGHTENLKRSRNTDDVSQELTIGLGKLVHQEI